MPKFAQPIILEEALKIVDDALCGLQPTAETVPVRNAVGRVLLADQRSPLDLPPFNKSAMDGYAVSSVDEREDYAVVETVPAGSVGVHTLKPGTAAKVMTGAPVPEGAKVVVPVEDTQVHGDRLRILRSPGSHNICWKGEDVRAGDIVLAAGTLLGPLEAANLVACGITEVEVARKLRVSIISTGNEIVDSPDELSPGKIMNSNGPMLAMLATQRGMEVVSEQSIPDEIQATESAVAEAVRESDIAILSGGVSVGEYDLVLDALAAVGLNVRFSRVAVQPGRPTVFATSAEGKPLFALPGNPVSVFLMFHLFVLRAVGWLAGKPPDRREFTLPLAKPYRRRKADRLCFVPARLTESGAVEPIDYHGSAHLLALVSADGFIKVPLSTAEVAEGEKISFLPIRL